MGLLNDCQDAFYQSLPACTDGFFVQHNKLIPGEDYFYLLTDKFGHVYSEVVTADDEHRVHVSADDFPEGFFNEYAGSMVLEFKGNIYYCASMYFIIGDGGYTKFVIDFKKGSLPAVIPCL